MTETWYPAATRRDGPNAKQGYVSFPHRTLLDITGAVGHSMEGSLAAALGELDRADRRASWTFSNPKSGPLLQHYPLESVTWANGSIDSNFLFVPCEHEGVAGELINANQRQNLADLLGWLDYTCPNIKGWERQRSAWEHKEMTAFGSDPTACPSNRIPWAQVLALLEDDMALSPEALKAMEDFFAKPYTDRAGRPWPNCATYVVTAIDWLDNTHLKTIFDKLDANVDMQPVLDAIKNLKLAAT